VPAILNASAAGSRTLFLKTTASAGDVAKCHPEVIDVLNKPRGALSAIERMENGKNG
jgi:hypothetical protein